MCYRELKYAYIWYVYCGIGHKHHADISHRNRHLKSTIFPLFWHKISAKSKLTSDASRSNVSRLTGPWSTGTTTHCPPLSFPTSPPLSFPLTGHPPPQTHRGITAHWRMSLLNEANVIWWRAWTSVPSISQETAGKAEASYKAAHHLKVFSSHQMFCWG